MVVVIGDEERFSIYGNGDVRYVAEFGFRRIALAITNGVSSGHVGELGIRKGEIQLINRVSRSRIHHVVRLIYRNGRHTR